jgi:hypothetical protein
MQTAFAPMTASRMRHTKDHIAVRPEHRVVDFPNRLHVSFERRPRLVQVRDKQCPLLWDCFKNIVADVLDRAVIVRIASFMFRSLIFGGMVWGGVLACSSETSRSMGAADAAGDVTEVSTDSDVAARDATDDGAVDASGCAAQQVRSMSPTSEMRGQAVRFHWTGRSCLYTLFHTTLVAGVAVDPPTSCVGRDCASLFTNEDVCIARYAACGAIREVPQRGVAFVGTPSAGVPCGSTRCSAGQECALGILSPVCRTPSTTDARRLQCDDALDCEPSSRCCVSEDGPYVVSSCDPTCNPTRSALVCSSDADCTPGDYCCRALARYFFTVSTLGACTHHTCETP